MPKTDPIHKDLHDARAVANDRDAEVARIEAALAALANAPGPDPSALEAAQDRFERAAASLHLGDGTSADLAAASSALDAARIEAERAARDHADIDATRSGLQRRLQQAREAATEAHAAALDVYRAALRSIIETADGAYVRHATEVAIAAARVKAAQALLSVVTDGSHGTISEPHLPPIGPRSQEAHRQNAPGTGTSVHGARITKHLDPATVRAAIESELAGTA
jgi:hypothetical protein